MTAEAEMVAEGDLKGHLAGDVLTDVQIPLGILLNAAGCAEYGVEGNNHF